MSLVRFAGLACLLAIAEPAVARPVDPGIRTAIARWYEELAKRDEGRLGDLVTAGFIDASPPVTHARTRSRALGPRLYTSLAARALKFDWEIDSVRGDSRFARVEVWERGYFYASAARQTYENAAATSFILERSDKDGRWRIAAHQSGSYGIPPNKITDPMPDVSALFGATRRKGGDPR
jgi:hypothetical protein